MTGSRLSNIDRSFWRGRRVLLTGHTGFKGAWAALLLSRLGAEVHGLSLSPEEPSLFSAARVAEMCASSSFVDLRDREATHASVVACQPQVVLHFAAQSLVRRAFLDPVETFSSNVMGTVHLLEALRHIDRLQTVLVTTTDKVYYNAETGEPFREGDRLGGVEAYGASKTAVEHVVAAYRASYFAAKGVAVLVARAGNVIGGGDWSQDRILPDIVRACECGRPLDVRNPGAVRPWQHVLEALEGYLMLVERKGQDEQTSGADPENNAWNFGPPMAAEMVTVAQICDWAAQAWPERFRWRHTPDASGVKESNLLLLDPSRAMAELGWRPRLGPVDALQITLGWYKSVEAGQDPRQACLVDMACLGLATP